MTRVERIKEEISLLRGLIQNASDEMERVYWSQLEHAKQIQLNEMKV